MNYELNLRVMKKNIKYICISLLMAVMSVNAWGTMYIEYGGNNYSPGDVIPVTFDQSEYDYNYVIDNITLTLKNSSPGWTAASGSGYTYGYMQYACNTSDEDWYFYISYGDDSYKNNNQYGSQSVIVGFGSSVAGTFDGTLTIKENDYYNGTALQSGTFTIRVTVIADCTEPTVEFSDAGPIYKQTGWSNFTNAATAKVGGVSTGQTISYSSSNTDVATINPSTGEVTIKAVGNTTITASVSEQTISSTTYCAKSATYTLYVYTAPTVTNTNLAVSNITPTSATIVGGQVTNRNGRDISQYGWILNTTSTVDKDNKVTAAGYNANPSLNTNFASKNITGLTAGTTYYVRPFANNGSYGYGPAGGIISFTTPYPITLDKNGGTTDGSAYLMPNGTSLTNISAPTKTGYTLEGYYTTSGVSTKIATKEGALQASVTVSSTDWTNSSSEWVLGANATFYAKWGGTISFDANGGGGSMTPQVVASGDTYELPSCTLTAPSGKVFKCWAEGSSSGTERAVGYEHTVDGNITFYAVWRDPSYTDYKFSCADWELTGPSGDIVFITSTASKTVRSQEAFHVSGNGLPHETALTFTTFPVNTKFEFKKADGTIPQTNEFGVVDADVYAFYTPDAGDTSDGLDELTSLTVSVTGEPRTATIDTKRVIGRHLPADFVIAVKHDDNQWYALPADMSGTGNPAPVAIRVDNTSSPTTAYCDNTNAYSLYASTLNNISVQLAMPNNPNMANAALWANNAVSSTNIGKNSNTNGSSTGLGGNYQWLFTQTATSVSGIGDVKYTMSNPNNANPLKVRTNGGSTFWGLYLSGSAEIRLLSMEVVKPLSLKVMEWGTDAIVVSYPNGGSATSPQVRIGDGDAANVTLTSLGGDIYKIATISDLQSNPAKTLIFTATESSVAKQIALAIPLIVWDAKTEADLRGAVPGANATEKNKVAKLTDVIIRNGGRLTTGTASGNFNDIYIYPGGKAKITNNFAANNIYMRGGYSFLDEKATFRYPDLCVEGAVTIDLPAANKLYYDFYIDNRKYYMFSMPQDVTLESVTDEAGYDDFPVWVKHYDGNLRASGHGVSGWTWYGDEEGQGSFFAGIGYEITAKPKTSGRPIAIIRFPVITGDITTDAENSPGVTVTYYGKSAYETGTQTANNVGWNFIGNPYLTEYKAVSDTSMIVKSDFKQHKENGQWDGTYEWIETSARFITVPCDTYNDYRHELVKGYTIPAFSTFFFQFTGDADGTFHMGGTRPQADLAPARFGAVPKAKPEISLDIMLHGTGEAEEGKAGLIIHETYDGGLKDFEDVEQWFVGNNIQKTYTFASGTALAYNLLNEQAATELIPMGYIATVGGEHVYALNEENDVSALEHLWLIDYTTGVTTDLLVRNYSFVTAAGRFDSRFAINAVLKQEEVPTDISNTPGGDWTTTIGVYSGENMLTLRGLPDNSAVYIYDMNGRLLQSSEKLSNIASFSIATQGVYNIRVIAEGKAITLRTVLR